MKKVLLLSLLAVFGCEDERFSSSDLKNYLHGKWRASYMVYSDAPSDTIKNKGNYLYIFSGDSLISGSEDWINVKEKIPYHVRRNGVIYKNDKRLYLTTDGKKGMVLKIKVISTVRCEWIAKDTNIILTTGLERVK